MSAASVMSSATPTSGFTPKALAVAPRRPISSCTVATGYVSKAKVSARFTASIMTYTAIRLSMALQLTPLPISAKSRCSVTMAPISISSLTSSADM